MIDMLGGVGTHKLLLRGQPSPTIPAQGVDLCHMTPTFLSHLGYMVQPQQKTLEFELEALVSSLIVLWEPTCIELLNANDSYYFSLVKE